MSLFDFYKKIINMKKSKTKKEEVPVKIEKLPKPEKHMKTLNTEQIRSVIKEYLHKPNSKENRESMCNDLLKLYEDKKVILKDITTLRQVDAGTCYFVATDGKSMQTILIMPEGISIN